MCVNTEVACSESMKLYYFHKGYCSIYSTYNNVNSHISTKHIAQITVFEMMYEVNKEICFCYLIILWWKKIARDSPLLSNLPPKLLCSRRIQFPSPPAFSFYLNNPRWFHLYTLGKNPYDEFKQYEWLDWNHMTNSNNIEDYFSEERIILSGFHVLGTIWQIWTMLEFRTIQ